MRCTLKAFCATMSLVRRMNTMIKQGAALPFNTSSCYDNATKKVVDGCNAFVPNINTSISSMT
ncbi:GM16341 [Drosophila sechellia]|uniref:GM16341 n=1 Tax=Drosophila sechellia TaxID=7238 RepID=B4IGT1_DROSE|nr:GM16341 [Drosophila sechellia]